jgi:hypothetical protein
MIPHLLEKISRNKRRLSKKNKLIRKHTRKRTKTTKKPSQRRRERSKL